MFDHINTRTVVFNLVMTNIVLFIASYMFPALNDMLSLHYLFNTHHFSEGVGFQPYQIITHMFMHGGIMHIAFNMFALYMFGNILERVWGPQRFLLFYFTTGLGAVFLHMLSQAIIVHSGTGSFDPSISMLEMHPAIQATYFSSTLGASGAVFGVLTAFAVLFPNAELMLLFFPIPVKAKYLVPVYILLELYLGFAGGDNIAHFAHLGGALFGFLLVKYWNHNRDSLY